MNAPAGPGQQDKDVATRTTDTAYEAVMKACIRVMKEMPKTYKQLDESGQDAVIAKLDYDVKPIIRDIVLEIAAAERPNIRVTLEQVVFKDGIKATVTMGRAGDDRHQLADAVGGTVILVIADSSEYTKGEKPKGEPLQIDLGLGTAIQEAMTDAEKKQAEEDKTARDEEGSLADLLEVGFEVTAEEIANWSLEEITEARACAVALKNQVDGEEVVLPPILAGRFRKGKPTDITDQE